MTVPFNHARSGAGLRRILVVDDDRSSLMFLEGQLADLGYEPITARDGAEAYEILRTNPGAADIVLADKVMPVMDGLTLVKRLKATPSTARIPVVMLTGDSAPADIQAGVDAGVFYYLTKPVSQSLLMSVVGAALRDAGQQRSLSTELGRHRAAFGNIELCRFRLRSLDECESVASLIASCFPDADRALTGVYELLVNAVEHGTVQVGFDQKAQLLKNGAWRDEVARRLTLPEFAGRSVEATVARKPEGVFVVIKDEGPGFDWQAFLKIDPARAGYSHGRGVAKAFNVAFDKLTYQGAGNHVIGFVSAEPKLNW